MPARGRITPWIENLIGSYGRDEDISVGQLKAHVIGVGHMSQSQAQGSEGPTGLLYLSDEQVHIPAVLTASAWEDLQDYQDLECFSTLVNHTVWIKDYRLLFHMSTEQTRSSFFLSVGKLATHAVGIMNNTPSCTSLPSVQTKICQTWRALLGQEDSQKSQTGLDLTELLGEWQQDCLLAELEHVREKLSTVTPQPSTSIMNPTMSIPDTCNATSWDMDTVRYKGVTRFTIPVQQLLIPESWRQLNVQPQSAQTGPDNVRNTERSETSGVSMDQQVSSPDISTRNQCASGGSAILLEDPPVVLNATEISPVSNPWDMCSPPSSTSSTKSSPEATPAPNIPLFTESITNHRPVVTSTQHSAPSSKRSQTELTAEPSLFPPYQRPCDTAPPLSTSISSSGSANALSNLSQAADSHSSTTTQETSNQQPHGKRSMRKRSVPPIEDVVVVLEDSQDEQMDSSPPSWLFDSQICSTPEESSTQSQGHTVGWVPKVAPSVHSDGQPFSYSYQVKGQDLLQFSRFTVEQPVLQWAVRYLLRPQHTEHKRAGTTAPGAADSHFTLS